MFRRFFRNADGNVAMIFALAMVPVIVAAGGAVDYTRGEQLRMTVQDALDAATLAAGREIGKLSESELHQKVEDFYYANLGTKLDNPPAVTTKLTGATLESQATVVSPNSFLGLIGLPKFTYLVTSEVTSGIGTLEVALVLDNSGSMAGSKISTLKTAATDLADTLYGLASTSTKPDPIKLAVVPFAGAVNVGSSYNTATWMDGTAVGTYHADSIEKAYYDTYGTTTSVNNFSLFTNMGVTWGGCVEARPIPYDATDDTPSTGTAGTMFVPMLAPDDPDGWTCSTSSCTYAGSSSSTRRFLGAPTGSRSYNNYLPDVAAPRYCGDTVTITIANPGVVTRTSHGLKAGDRVVFNTTGALPSGLTSGTMYYVKTVLTANTFTVTSTSGGSAIRTTGSQSGTHTMTSSAMWNCDSGSANCNGTGNGVSDKAAFARVCKYNQTPASITVGGISGGPNFMCTSKALTPLSTNQSTITSALNAMIASGSTNIGEGVGWGWRVLSPSDPFTGGRAYSDTENQKIIVLMTDGENTYYPQSGFTLSWYSAWGHVWNGHLGTTSTDTDTLTTKMNERTLQACTNAKAAGVKIYTVGFEINAGTTSNPSAALTLLKNCATDTTMYYDAANESELLAAFTAIGDSITSLRVSK